MKIIHERKKCIGCGACAAICPTYFEMKDDGKADLVGGTERKNEIYELEIKEETEDLKEAVEACPVVCFNVKKD